MIDAHTLSQYVKLKQRLIAVVSDPQASGFQHSQREFSEGLARSIDVDGEPWTYSSVHNGYSFSHSRRRFRVTVPRSAPSPSAFTGAEILGYLQAFTAHERLNQLVVDMWLLKAAQAGIICDAPGVPGGFTLQAQAHARGA